MAFIVFTMKSELLIFSYKIQVEMSSLFRLCMIDAFHVLLQIQKSEWEQSEVKAFTQSILSLQIIALDPFRWPTSQSLHILINAHPPAPSGSEVLMVPKCC